jgi:hypothetical protein
MSVPADKLSPTPPVAPLTPEQKLENIIKAFGEANKTATNNPGDDLRKVLDASPDLKKRILDSVDKGFLTSFNALDPKSGAGGSYDPTTKAINLPMDVLKRSATNAGDKAELIFVMGHEIQHSFNATQTAKTTQDFVDGVEKVAKSKTSPHNYTTLIENFTEASRKDEASAHIGGFNAIASQARKDDPKATLKDIYEIEPGRMQDFIDRTGTAPKFSYALKAGLTVDANMNMAASKDNVAAMGKYYFDKPANVSQLGANGNLDYTNYYGGYAVTVVGEYEKAYQAANLKADKTYKPPEVQLDMKRLGLKETLIEQDLKFSDNKPFSYVDTSGGKSKAATFDPQVTPAPTKALPISPQGYEAPLPIVRAEERGLGAHSLSQNDRALFDQAFVGIGKLKDHPGTANPQAHENAAFATASEAKSGGLDKIDLVLKSTKDEGLFAVQTNPLGAEHNKRVYVDVQALQQPIEKSMTQLNQTSDNKQEQSTEQQQKSPAAQR